MKPFATRLLAPLRRSVSTRMSVTRMTAVSCMLVALFVAANAWAAGTFKLRTTSVQEVSGGWHVYCELSLPKPPPIAHQTLKFVFTKTMAYERDLVDNNPNPVVNRQALTNQNPSVESLEVDFANASGTIYARTVFDFSLTRTRGYEAGEYKVQVRTGDGVDIGGSANIILNGDNPVVDRRAMSFEAKSGMKKVASNVETPAKTDETVAAAPLNGEVAPAGSAPPFLTNDAFQKQPEEIAAHPSGCGCRVVPVSPGGRTGLVLAAVGLGLIASRRKRAVTPL